MPWPRSATGPCWRRWRARTCACRSRLALSWPERWSEAAPPLSALDLANLTFEAIDPAQHPAFACALAAGRTGGTAPCVLNAADEVAVQAFHDGVIALGALPEVLERVLSEHDVAHVESLQQLREVDLWAREAARRAVMGA